MHGLFADDPMAREQRACAAEAGYPAPRAATRSPTCCSARSTRAGSCRCRSRSTSARSRSPTTSSRPAGRMTRTTSTPPGTSDAPERAAVPVRLRALIHHVLVLEPAERRAACRGTGRSTSPRNITNTGSTAGTDVVQLYLHESDTTILQPVKKLEGFQRVTLAPERDQDRDVHARAAEPRLLQRAGAVRGRAGSVRPLGG